MRKLNTKKLQIIHSVFTEYEQENKNMVFDIPSLMQYCIENDIRKMLEEKRFHLNEINRILQSIDFDVNFKHNKSNNNSVKIKLNYRDFISFESSYKKIV